jgi:hypothetical protein
MGASRRRERSDSRWPPATDDRAPPRSLHGPMSGAPWPRPRSRSTYAQAPAGARLRHVNSAASLRCGSAVGRAGRGRRPTGMSRSRAYGAALRTLSALPATDGERQGCRDRERAGGSQLGQRCRALRSAGGRRRPRFCGRGSHWAQPGVVEVPAKGSDSYARISGGLVQLSRRRRAGAGSARGRRYPTRGSGQGDSPSGLASTTR